MKGDVLSYSALVEGQLTDTLSSISSAEAQAMRRWPAWQTCWQ